ncbi:15019_t:CDS:2 [Entrophospora sp. SA101]|nr:15019_t:CDS:2 [Entrophospora sp. SA101]
MLFLVEVSVLVEPLGTFFLPSITLTISTSAVIKYDKHMHNIQVYHIVETVQDNFEEESSQLEHLIDKLPFDDPIMAIDYITIDNEVVEEETVMEDEEIIATVTLTSNNGNQEEEIETPVVTLTEALRGAEALLNFVTYPPEKFEISTKQISSIRSVRSSILLYKSSLVHQRSIDEYVNFDV